METICQHCGGKGFERAYVYCVRCLNFAVHRYCLPKVPKTFDEFVRWYCYDCEPKPAKRSPLEKPCSTSSTKSDHVISKGVRVTKFKKKDVSCSVPKTEELAVTESAQLVRVCSLPKSESKVMENGGVSSVAETEDQGQQSSPSHQHSEAHTKLQWIEHTRLAGDCSHVDVELNGKKSNVTHSIVATEEVECRSSCSQPPCEAQAEHALCILPSSPLNGNTTMHQCSGNHGNDLELQKTRRMMVEGETNLGEEAESVRIDDSQTTAGDCSLPISKLEKMEKAFTKRDHVISKGLRVTKSKKKDVSCSVPETEELALTESAQLVSVCSLPISKLKKVENVSTKRDHVISKGVRVTKCKKTDVPETEELALTVAQLVSDRSLPKSNLKVEKGGVSSVAGTEGEGQQSSPSHKHSEAQTNLHLIEHAQLAGDCSYLEEVECRSSFSQPPCHVQTERALCVVPSSPLNDNMTIHQCSENHGNGLKLDKRSLIVEGENNLGVEAESVRIDNSQIAAGDLSNTFGQSYQLHAQPLQDQIWSGSISVSNKVDGLFNGVVAHLSIKACEKVWEKACLLPSLVSMEMLPKSSVWPKSFERSGPSDENIGLYFFPECKRYERVFDCLVDDLMDQELAMRAIVTNAELLVFPSAELPIQYWKFQGKYYLWGVFRNKQAPSLQPTDQSLVVHNSNIEPVMHTILANGVGHGEDDNNPAKTKTWDGQRRSPLSPLSNSDYGSDVELESEN